MDGVEVSLGTGVLVRVGVMVGVLLGVKVGYRVGMIGAGVKVIKGVGVNVSVWIFEFVGVGSTLRLIETKAYPKP
jgi:hypothetical protein